MQDRLGRLRGSVGRLLRGLSRTGKLRPLHTARGKDYEMGGEGKGRDGKRREKRKAQTARDPPPPTTLPPTRQPGQGQTRVEALRERKRE